MKTVVEFDHEKAAQALNFFARKEGGSISKLKAVKLIWLADRYHLRKYGRPITNDEYFAMQYGPVGSSVKDLAECSSFLSTVESKYLNKFLTCDKEAKLITSQREVDEDVFSDSDLEALQSVYEKFGKLKPSQLVNYSHLFPEWAKFADHLESKVSTRAVMSYSDFFSNPAQRSDSFFEETPERLQASKETFQANFDLANFWLG